MIPFTQPRVVIRPTLPADTPDVLEFCKYIWGGHSSSQYVKIGDAFGERGVDVKSAGITADVLLNLPSQ